MNDRMETSVPDIYAAGDAVPVSYTHLDVYKRQVLRIQAVTGIT